jgi:hypothetical protein
MSGHTVGPTPDPAMVRAVGDDALGRIELGEYDAFVEDASLEQAVEYSFPSGSNRLLEVRMAQLAAQCRARDHTRLRRRSALGLHGDEVADDHQDRPGGERKRDARRDREAEDEPRRVSHGHAYGCGRIPVTVFVPVSTAPFAVSVAVVTVLSTVFTTGAVALSTACVGLVGAGVGLVGAGVGLVGAGLGLVGAGLGLGDSCVEPDPVCVPLGSVLWVAPLGDSPGEGAPFASDAVVVVAAGAPSLASASRLPVSGLVPSGRA